MIGTVLDKYEVLQKVGEGGMATVYRGRHTTLDREVAIKVLHPHLSSSPRNRKRFAREAGAIEQMRHDNILEIFDYSGEDADDCYIVTEFVRGETLTELLSRCGRMPSEVVAMVGIPLARALACAHEQGLLHRDLKPDNVMIRADGTVKLMDFGIARFLHESQVTMTGALVGSPAFMSPEQAVEGDLDARSDLFSLGTMLYYLVTGNLPFAGNNPSLILKNIIEGNRPGVTELAPSMSATLADVVECLLQKDRNDRYNSANDVAVALERVLQETGITAGAVSWSLQAFSADPDAYVLRLEAHLRTALMAQGRTYLSTGDHLGALRLFNRLLSLDENNEEVLALVQGLHGETEKRRSLLPLAGGAVAIAGAAVFALWLIGAATPPSPEPTVAHVPLRPPVAVSVPSPGVPAPESPTAPVVASVSAASASVVEPVRAHLSPPDFLSVRSEQHLPTSPVASAPPAPDLPGKVHITLDNELWAYVLIDSAKVGTTRDHIDFAIDRPGTHALELTGPHVVDYKTTFTTAPGETATLPPIHLQAFRQVTFAADCNDACVLVFDRKSLGPIVTVGRSLDLPNPDQGAQDLVARCPGVAEVHRSYDPTKDGPEVTFSCAP